MYINDTIMVDIDGNIVPCTVLDIEYASQSSGAQSSGACADGFKENCADGLNETASFSSASDYGTNDSSTIPINVKLLDTGSGRHFWRSYEALRASKRFDGQIVTYHGYMDWLKSNRPDITIKFCRHAGHKAAAPPKEKKPVFSDKELATLLSLLQRGKLS